MEKQKRRNALFKQAGNLCFDIAKIIFGGIIVVGIMQEESLSNSLFLRIFASGTVIALIIVGFIFHYNERRKNEYFSNCVYFVSCDVRDWACMALHMES